MDFRTDTITQSVVNVLIRRSQVSQLIKMSDNYHGRFQTAFDKANWETEFKQYLERHHPKERVWRFTLYEHGTVYFIGESFSIETKIRALYRATMKQ